MNPTETTETTEDPTATTTVGRREAGGLVATVVGLTVLLRLPAFFVPVFNSDEPFLATQAAVLRHGGRLYRDTVDRKPPLVPYVYAAGQWLTGSDALWVPRVAAMVAVVVTALLLAHEAYRRGGRVAMWCAGILTVAASVAFAAQDGQAANFEIFMLPFTVLAVVLARRGSTVRAGGAGAAVAVAGLTKQTGLATLLPVVWSVWRRHRWRGLVAAGVGVVVPLVVAGALFGPSRLVYWTVTGNASYVSLGSAALRMLGMFGVMTFAWVACNLPITWPLPKAWRDRRVVGSDGDDDLDLWWWTLGAAVSVAFGFRFFGHYYLQLVPPVALLAAVTLSRMSPRAVRATLALALVSGTLFSIGGYVFMPFGGEPGYERVAAAVAARTGPDDTVFVWGNVPEITWRSGRRPATRFAATGSLVTGDHAGRTAVPRPDEIDPRIWRWLLHDLRTHPPAVVVDTTATGVRGASRTPMDRYPEVARWRDRNYHRVATIDGYAVWARNP